MAQLFLEAVNMSEIMGETLRFGALHTCIKTCSGTCQVGRVLASVLVTTHSSTGTSTKLVTEAHYCLMFKGFLEQVYSFGRYRTIAMPNLSR